MKVIYLGVIFIIVLMVLILNGSNNFVGQVENFKNQISRHIVTEILIRSCDELNIKYKLLDTNKIYIYDKNKNITFNRLYNNLNSKKSVENCNKKHITSSILGKHNIPVPKNNVFNKIISKEDIDYIIETNNINYPLVVKPIDSTAGTKVFVNIKNDHELRNILDKEFLNQKIYRSETQKIMIEDYIDGVDHRILCYKDNVLDIIKRTPSYVIGDGYSTIQQLVDKKNIQKKKLGHHPIKIDKYYLKKNKYDTKSIINKEEYLTVNPVSNFHKGAFIEIVPLKEIHPDNLTLFRKVNGYLDLELSGIDFLIKNIKKSYKTQKCAINEVNTSPNLDLHWFLRRHRKNSLEIPKRFLTLFFDIPNKSNA